MASGEGKACVRPDYVSCVLCPRVSACGPPPLALAHFILYTNTKKTCEILECGMPRLPSTLGLSGAMRIRCASGRMRQDTLLSSGGLASPPFPPPPFTFSPGARPIMSGMHGCGGWLGLVLYIGPGWGYGGGPRRGVGRCGLVYH
eukprot:scaffold2908_cov105-Isochrysis_galbana.AAC.9